MCIVHAPDQYRYGPLRHLCHVTRCVSTRAQSSSSSSSAAAAAAAAAGIRESNGDVTYALQDIPKSTTTESLWRREASKNIAEDLGDDASDDD